MRAFSTIALLTFVSALSFGQSPSAADLSQQGQFPEALAACDAVLTKAPDDHASLLLKGKLLMRMNRIADARAVFLTLSTRADLPPADKTAIYGLLGEAAYREDNFRVAAPYFRDASKETKAAQLEDFQHVKPNEITPDDKVATVKFLVTDPLPVVALKANGVEGRFIIDTGAGETVLDPDFAAKIGVKAMSGDKGTFAGGATAVQGNGRLDSLQFDSVTVKNLPIHILNTKNFSSTEFKGQIDGVIGTVLFYHFTTTLDYPHNQLILAPRKAVTPAKEDVSVPFWLASDHLILANGRLGKSDEHLFIIDTGLSGAAFTGPKSITDEAGIRVSLDNAQMGEGGGGKVAMAPYEVPDLSLGPITEHKLIGVYGAFPDSLENSLGFHISGIISHQFFRPYAVTFDFEKMKIVLRNAKPVLTASDLVLLNEHDNPTAATNLNLWFMFRSIFHNFGFGA